MTTLLRIVLSCAYLSGCVLHTPVVSPDVRTMQATALAKNAGWHEHTIYTKPFTLKTYRSPALKEANTLTIYIEGDGLAWLSEEMPSANPTPIVPTGLQMALHDQQHNPIVYLARPCQFVKKNGQVAGKHIGLICDFQLTLSTQ